MLEQLPVLLLPWFAEHRRDLPWRRDREPYHVWLSEIMLQQTRVEAVRGYYLRFLERLPDIAALASAPEDVLLKLWEGLGYYSRVRNLQKAAQCVMEQHGGEFPRELPSIRALPGIGDYTAGAIASICFEEPAAAVDGNVLRVILRLTVCADTLPRSLPRPSCWPSAPAFLMPDFRRSASPRWPAGRSTPRTSPCNSCCCPKRAPPAFLPARSSRPGATISF